MITVSFPTLRTLVFCAGAGRKAPFAIAAVNTSAHVYREQQNGLLSFLRLRIRVPAVECDSRRLDVRFVTHE